MGSMRHAHCVDWRLVHIYHKELIANSVAAVAAKTGYIVFKERFVMSFYINDLADITRLRLHTPDQHAIAFVLWLAPLERWIGNKLVRHTTLKVPAVIVLYNLFMNAVDHFDHFRSTSATMRKEKRVFMSLLTFILDASIINAHASLNAITESGKGLINLIVMKKRNIQQPTSDYIDYEQERASLRSVPRSGSGGFVLQTNSVSREPHILLET